MEQMPNEKPIENIVSVAALVGKDGLQWHKVAEFHCLKPSANNRNSVEVTTTCGLRAEFPVWSWMQPMKDLDCHCVDCYGECQCYRCQPND